MPLRNANGTGPFSVRSYEPDRRLVLGRNPAWWGWKEAGTGNLTEAELAILERVACPGAGACGAQYTANTMACVSEAMGLALLNSSGAPAPYESRDQYGDASGVAVMNSLAGASGAMTVPISRPSSTARASALSAGPCSNCAR